MTEKKEIMLIDEQSLKKRIYTIRDQQVMLDFDLAEVYGYETRYLNLQVKRNLNRFPVDFMFQLTPEEYDNLMLKISTSKRGGRRKLPYVFTEQGVYQLATVLRGEIAERQSVAIMRVFKTMREYISQNKQFLPQQELIRISGKQTYIENELREIKSSMVTKAELSDFMKLFDSNVEQEEVLILDGEPFKADLAYQKIYCRARKSLIVIDDYISAKTLHHLLHSKASVELTIISDNKARPPLRQAEYTDFQTENPGRSIIFYSTDGKIHDRYIILDNGTKDMKVYHCGASSKDAGKKITTITQVKDILQYRELVKELLTNPPLILR